MADAAPAVTPRPYRTKRALDWAVLAVVAVPAALLGGLIALVINATSEGPVLFRQERVGRNGAHFRVLKFRTMVHGDNPVVPDASRITRVGRVLRRLSLDELPQLVNVARGEMSVVGPRPTLPYQVERYDTRQRARLSVRPGITGLAQVRGRNALTWAERIELDLQYVATQSLWQDLRILTATVVAVLGSSGVEGHQADDPFVAIDDLDATPDADTTPEPAAGETTEGPR